MSALAHPIAETSGTCRSIALRATLVTLVADRPRLSARWSPALAQLCSPPGPTAASSRRARPGGRLGADRPGLRRPGLLPAAPLGGRHNGYDAHRLGGLEPRAHLEEAARPRRPTRRAAAEGKPGAPGAVPPDLVYTSGSGLDPEIAARSGAVAGAARRAAREELPRLEFSRWSGGHRGARPRLPRRAARQRAAPESGARPAVRKAAATDPDTLRRLPLWRFRPGNGLFAPRSHGESTRESRGLSRAGRARKRGRLKLYIGFAAGVGKTYRMLEEAHALKRRGVDVVLGFVETHGRAETAALVDGLEEIPRQKVEYRGVTVEEMDLDGILARRPTSSSSTRSPTPTRRAAGTAAATRTCSSCSTPASTSSAPSTSSTSSGSTTRRAQHRRGGARDRARQLPQAGRPGRDLGPRRRGSARAARAGKIYAADKIPWALEHFFRPENLSTLRELALREVAESLDRAHREAGPSGRTRARRSSRCAEPAGDGLHVVVPRRAPPSCSGAARAWPAAQHRLVRRLRRDAARGAAPHRRRGQRHLLANIEMARELGAEVVRFEAAIRSPRCSTSRARTASATSSSAARSAPWWRQLDRPHR